MLTTLRRIVLSFSQQPELDAALDNMVSDVKRAMNTDCCSIYLVDYQKQHFVLMASDGLAKASLGRTTIEFSEGLVGLVGQREEPINVANARSHPRFKYAPEVQEDDLNAFLGTPIIHQRKVLGVISVQQRKARQFNETEEAFLVTLAAQLAVVIANIESKEVLSRNKNQQNRQIIQGVPASPGLVIGPLYVSYPEASLAGVNLVKTDNAGKQAKLLSRAVAKTKQDLLQMSERMRGVIADDTLDIFEMYRHLLESASLSDEIFAKIEQGWSAQSALKLVIEQYVLQFEAVEDAYIQERATDIKDLGNRVLFHLQQQNQVTEPVPTGSILVADEVTVSLLAQTQNKGVKAIISLKGSTNSHAVILARALGIPAIVAVGDVPLSLFIDKQAIIDGYSGQIYLSPDVATLKEYQLLVKEESELQQLIAKDAHLPAVTLDGRTVQVLLNAGLSSQFNESIKNGASGIGLYRTEVPFMERACFPSEHEQIDWYKRVLQLFPRQSVVMRTLDVGGDKALSYFPISEDNPFLGWRGIRITLDHPEIFLVQVRAMLKANIGIGNLEIMLPMVSRLSEVDDAIRLINQAYFEVANETQQEIEKPKIGIMIEVPSLIFQLGELAEKVDFFSVGSNDLTQYLLAVDRNNVRVAALYDAYHPAVLRALKMIADQAQQSQIELSLCGELASEPGGALLLMAMGYDKLSMSSHSVIKIKWLIRNVNYHQSQHILAQCLALQNAHDVHTYLNAQLELLGLGGFVRAGK
ncbi:phosphoenolpyruvate--protein phosphotransferase [Thalassotalea ponticola]|uniref:phosphoenolpyruvate--protein phosphotransferase n=1 Tax=Thalassotalea ponticola TaxID=1523392 RepID=UPI0025B3CAFF|nr:phosphoenolpyruvate--protein phosphotransferase [Thalassotalea ponticola]MDN3651718.1 phosphoenolpyruvate--protein phosphotransferase [Thalassotalea ponticola]